MQTIETKNKPQIKVPRVTPLEGVSTSTVTPVDCVHTYASALAYVDARPQGAQPLTYAPYGIRVRGVENPQGFGIDERRFIESGIQRIFVDDIDSNLINSPQRTQSSQRFFMNTFNPCVSVSSVQSVFYYIPYCIASVSASVSAFICVHLRLIISNQKSEII
jgi:hypothetical protein